MLNRSYQNYIDRLSDAELVKAAEVMEDGLVEKIAVAIAPMVEDAAIRAVNTVLIKIAEAQGMNVTEAQAPVTSALHDPVAGENTNVISEPVNEKYDRNSVLSAMNEAFAAGQGEKVLALIQGAESPELAQAYTGLALSLVDGHVLAGHIDHGTGEQIKAQLRAALETPVSGDGY